MKKNRSGFTLAEVLITLVIIGIIAAMTIPTLMNKTNEQETVVAVKKAYSTLSQAYQRVVAENGEINSSLLGSNIVESSENLGELFLPYLNIQKVCGQTIGEDCWSTKNGGMYKFLDASDWFNWNGGNVDYKIRLNNGSSVGIYGYANSMNFGDSDSMQNVLGYINFDTNGDKGPNVRGKDVFRFWITKYGIVPCGLPEDTESPFASCVRMGVGCTAWVVTKGNMDYLRKEVSW